MTAAAKAAPHRYRKKPVVIEAERTQVAVVIKTLEGEMTAQPGDYIVTGVKGERYPVKPDIFDLTYELEAKPGPPSEAIVQGWECALCAYWFKGADFPPECPGCNVSMADWYGLYNRDWFDSRVRVLEDRVKELEAENATLRARFDVRDEDLKDDLAPRAALREKP